MHNLIAPAREHLGITQQALADRIGVPVATLAAWESGDEPLTLEGVTAISAALQLPVDFLLFGRIPPPTQ